MTINEKSNFPIPQTYANNYFDHDSVTIYDGSNDESTQIAKLSGYLESFGISSTGNSFFVKFESGVSGEYPGFLAEIHYGKPHMNIQ